MIQDPPLSLFGLCPSSAHPLQASSGLNSSLASEEQPASAEIRRDEEPARTASAEFAELVAREEAASWGISRRGGAADAAASLGGCDADLYDRQ